MTDFVHLHLHTQYSLLDGAARINDVIKRASELKMKSVAITDHGVMYGALEFYCEAISAGIKPIIGCEVYTAPGSRFDKNGKEDGNYGHLVLLCENEEGYENLLKLVTLSNTEGFYYKPRVDKELLSRYSGGLIALSGCLRSEVSQTFIKHGYDAALEKAREYADIFGKNNFFLEIQNHGIEEEVLCAEAFAKMSLQLGTGLVATNDVHYVKKEDALIQDVLMCIQTGKRMTDEDRMKMSTDEYYFKSGEEMNAVFSAYPEALKNTVRIAERCSLNLNLNTIHLPEIDLDTKMSHADFLRMLCIEGLNKKYSSPGEALVKRLDYELETINSMGYTDYFLIVYDFIKYAKNSKIPVGPGRGSAAGSLVSYVLDITEIDPMEYNLIFERFLNSERVSMPDIDIDFCFERRDEVREYVTRKYGSDKVAQIITFGTMAARAAIRDVARVFGTDLNLVNTITSFVPRVLNVKIESALGESEDLKRMYNTSAEVKRIIDIAIALEGFPRHASTHAAGVVISDRPLDCYVPLQNSDGGMLTQYSMASLEKIGLLKMDFLGLRNLTIISDTINSVNESLGECLDVNSIPTDDEKTFELISRGDTDGVFQLENPGLQSFLRKFRPKKLEDIVLTTSIYRPGPMEQLETFLENVKNPDKIKYKHPILKPILEPTCGVVIYQEQVMKIVREIAGYSLGRADIVRRVMAKKKHSEMLNERHIFLHGLEKDGKVIIPGAIRMGIDEKCANEIFDLLIDFANYAFNKSHAACYALVAYRTAYLKTHYTAYYLAAVLKNYAGYTGKAVKYINSFSKYKIKLLPPDVNKSGTHFKEDNGNIRFGLCWIKNVGVQFPEQIETERKNKGKFKSFYDFMSRMASYGINKRSIDGMIKVGCFDSLYPNRRVLLYNYERIADECIDVSKAERTGQFSWFSAGKPEASESVEFELAGIADFTENEKMEFEYDIAGMYFSGNPLDEHRMKIEAFSECTIDSLNYNQYPENKVVNVCAMISEFSQRYTKSGKCIATMTLTDYTGACKAVAFENVIRKYSQYLENSNAVAVCGSLSYRDGESEPELLLRSCVSLSELGIDSSKTMYVKVKNNDEFSDIKKLFDNYRGENNLVIYFEDSKTTLKSDKDHRVRICEELYEKLCTKLGYDNVKIK